jgi:hypothetical protein
LMFSEASLPCASIIRENELETRKSY